MLKREFHPTSVKLPGGDLPTPKILTGGRAKIMMNGKEVFMASNYTMTLKSLLDDNKVEEMRDAFKRSISSSVFSQRLEIEPLEVTMKMVTFDDSQLRNMIDVLSNYQDTSSDAMVEWMDMQASMTAEERELEAIWEAWSE